MRSLSRPGVATSTSAPRRRVADCLVIDMPPTTVASRRCTAVAYGVRASVTCWASSRVGTRTMASGARGSLRRPAVRASRARPKARVLPEPVRPRPRMSRPASEFGRVAPWIGKGSVTPCAARVFSSAAGMSRSAKASTDGSAGVTVSGRANSAGAATAGLRRAEGLEPPWGRERGAPPRPFAGAWEPAPWPRPRPRAGRERGVRSWRSERSELVIRNCPPGGFLGNCRMGLLRCAARPSGCAPRMCAQNGSMTTDRRSDSTNRGPHLHGAGPGQRGTRPTIRPGRCSRPAGPSGPA
ncbi:hypothetical protein SBADM41S_10801 [Streptomyces badius]